MNIQVLGGIMRSCTLLVRDCGLVHQASRFFLIAMASLGTLVGLLTRYPISFNFF